MRAVVFDKYGLGELRLKRDVPVPVASKAGELLIKVHASSINPVDLFRLQGGLKMMTPEPAWPALIGYDAAGVVAAVAIGGTGAFSVGDAVFVRLKDASQGSLSEFVVAHEQLVALKPTNMSFEQAASLPLAWMTALQALRRGGVKEGHRVVITGGAGGVGTAAIQLAKHTFKCSVVATTAKLGDNTDLVTELGADIVVDYRADKFEDKLATEEKFDFAFDTTNESHKMCALVKEGGHVVTIAGTPTAAELAAVSGTAPPWFVRIFLWLKRNVAAAAAAKCNVHWSYMFLSPNGDDLRVLAKAAEDGQIKAVIDAVHPMEHFQKAFDRLMIKDKTNVIKICE
jgi:alcohol dehydrogenase